MASRIGVSWIDQQPPELPRREHAPNAVPPLFRNIFLKGFKQSCFGRATRRVLPCSTSIPSTNYRRIPRSQDSFKRVHDRILWFESPHRLPKEVQVLTMTASKIHLSTETRAQLHLPPGDRHSIMPKEARSTDPRLDVQTPIRLSNDLGDPPSCDQSGLVSMKDQRSCLRDSTDLKSLEAHNGGLYRRDHSSGLLKQRSEAPPLVPSESLPAAIFSVQSSDESTPAVVPVHVSSSSLSSYSHHNYLPSHARLTISSGIRLISQPIFQTPVDASTSPSAALAANISGWSFPSIGFVTSQSMGGASWTPLPRSPIHQATTPVTSKTSRDAFGVAILEEPWRESSDTRPTVSTTSRIKQSSLTYGCPIGGRPAAKPMHAYMSRGQPPILYQDSIQNSPSKHTSHRTADPSQSNPATAFPALFADAVITTKACRCEHSKCLKLYCECFRIGVLCDEKHCRCKDCKNTPKENHPQGERQLAILRIIKKRPSAFKPKVRRPVTSCKCKKSQYVQLVFPRISLSIDLTDTGCAVCLQLPSEVLRLLCARTRLYGRVYVL
jgi:Tesmin/TSO1-like CXC domain, cysteine-rich domain